MLFVIYSSPFDEVIIYLNNPLPWRRSILTKPLVERQIKFPSPTLFFLPFISVTINTGTQHCQSTKSIIPPVIHLDRDAIQKEKRSFKISKKGIPKFCFDSYSLIFYKFHLYKESIIYCVHNWIGHLFLFIC